MSQDGIRAAVVGYGAAFNMGRHHVNAIRDTEGIDAVAVVDVDEERTAAAAEDWPEIHTFNSMEDLLDWDKFEVAVNVLPHHLHLPITAQCLKAGKHAIVEKPFTITIAEATELIETAKEHGVVLTVHHNRRWDADFWTLKGLIERDAIGEVFNVEMWGGGYGKPSTTWWRSDKAISGGTFHDWGAHFIDWLLNVLPHRMVNVTGFFHNLVWHDVSNEDHVHAIIRFENGCSADVQQSTIAMVGRPMWRLLGSHGAILSDDRQFKVITPGDDGPHEQQVATERRPGPSFYENFVAHVHDPDEVPLVVTPESARRVIAVLELAEKSSKTHVAETVPYEFSG